MRLLNFYASAICMIVGAATSTEVEKRAPPLGFTGVRGKKSIVDEPSSAYDDRQSAMRETANALDDADVEKRAPSGFMGMRGKKPYEEYVPLDYSTVYFKRAPSGFFGMRGKKESMDDYDKRAPSGFFGMRGKKEYDEAEMDKRAPSGFFGMRGKKSYEESMYDEVKRAAPPSGFFGMRGKKQPARSGFFGMRGKKYPYEFRGKFVGVRGKKSELDADRGTEEAEQVANGDGQLDLNQLMLLLTENSPNSNYYYPQDD